MEHKEFYQHPLVAQPNEVSEEVMQSLYVQIFMEFTLFHGEKERLEKEIDRALDQKDQCEFLKLTDRYLDLLAEYEAGIIVKEQGIHFHVFFGNYKVS